MLFQILSLLYLSCVQVFVTPWTVCSLPGSSVHGDSAGKNTGVGSHAFLQGIFTTQESNPGLQHCRRILYHLSHQGSPRIQEWVTFSFSKGSFQPRDQTGVFCIALQYFDYLMQRTDSLEKILMLRKIEGGRRRGRQRMR